MDGLRGEFYGRYEDRPSLGVVEEGAVTTIVALGEYMHLSDSQINLALVADVPIEDIPEIDDSVPVIEQFWRISKIWNGGQENVDNPVTVEEALMTLNRALTRCRDYRLALRIIQLRQDIVLNQAQSIVDPLDSHIALEQSTYNIHLV